MPYTLTPLNQGVHLKYSLTEREFNQVAPITTDGVLNMTQDQIKAIAETFGPDYFNPEWDFEQAQGATSFRSLLQKRLEQSALLQTAEVLSVSSLIEEEWGYLKDSTILLSNGLVGAVQKFDEGCLSFYTTFNIPKKINNYFPFMAYSKNLKKYEPVKGFVEIEVDIPPEFRFTKQSNIRIRGEMIPKKYDDPKEMSLKEFKQIAQGNSLKYMNPSKAKVVATNKNNQTFKQIKAGDSVFLKPSVNFRLDLLHRMDFDKGKVYYFTQENNLLSKIENE
jgi:hypothetical protein